MATVYCINFRLKLVLLDVLYMLERLISFRAGYIIDIYSLFIILELTGGTNRGQHQSALGSVWVAPGALP